MNSEEPSSNEPSSNEPPGPSYKNSMSHIILWTTSSGWYTWTKELGYPRPQGNLPMLQSLTPKKQQSLLNAYLSVNGNSVDHVNKEWMPYES